MSIIGLVVFGLCVFTLIADEDPVWGLIGVLYASACSIVGLIQANKYLETNVNIKENNSIVNQLLELNKLKEKGIISDDEFNLQKIKILN